MFPKEHGAYGQMLTPMITSLAVAGPSAPALLLAAAIVLAFIGHEPLVVLLGLRGPRAKRELRARATLWLAVLSAAALAAGVSGAMAMPADARWSLALPLAPAALVAAAIATRQEKAALGEIAVALTFSCAAVPLVLAGGASLAAAVAVAVVFAISFVVATLGVRRVIVAIRGGGNPRAARALRSAVLWLTACAAIALTAAAYTGRLPWVTLAATLPSLGVGIWLALWPPPASQLRRVGWTLVTTSTLAALFLIVGLRS